MVSALFGTSEQAYIAILSGKHGKQQETDGDVALLDMLTQGEATGVIEGQPKRRGEQKMMRALAAEQNCYLAIWSSKYKNWTLVTVTELVDLETVGVTQAPLMRFCIKPVLFPDVETVFAKRADLLRYIDPQCQDHSGIIRLLKQGSDEFQQRCESKIVRKRKDISRLESFMTVSVKQ